MKKTRTLIININDNYAILYPWILPLPVAAQSKALVCDLSPAEIVGSNSTGGMDICLLWVLCVFR